MTELVRLVGDPSRPARLVEDPNSVDNPILEFFLNYWQKNCGDAALPLHASFNPSHVRGNLPWVVLVDALPDYADFRYRVVGTNVARYFLGDGTGKTVREAFPASEAQLVEVTLWLYRLACTSRAPVRLTNPSSTVRGVHFPDMDAIFLPYSSDGRTADRLVNVITFNYQTFLAKRAASNLAR